MRTRRFVRGRRLIRVSALVATMALAAGCSATGGSNQSAAPSSTATTGGGATTSTRPGDSSGPTTTPSDAPEPDIDDVADPVFDGQGDPRVDVDHYDVTVRADPGKPEIAGTVTITLSALTAEPLASFTLDLAGPEVSEATIDGDPVRVASAGPREIELTPTDPLRPGEPTDVVIAYEGTPEPGSFPELGVPVGWQADDDGGWFTMSEPDGTATWVPVELHPSDKATWTITLDTPSEVEGVANGRLVSRDVDGDRRTWIWETAEPMASYLVFAGVGQYDLIERDGPDGTDAVFAFPTSLAEERRSGFEELDDIVAFYSEQFGDYPSDDTGAIVVATDLQLALETQTRPLFGTDSVGPGGVYALAHELAHQWFGNAVAPESWADLWLNESFATYADWLYEDQNGGTAIRVEAEKADGLSDLAVTDPEAAATFDVAIYNKGARALYALRLTVGDDTFADILRQWFATYDGTNAATEDFTDLASEVAGEDLTSFFADWIDAADQPAALPR